MFNFVWLIFLISEIPEYMLHNVQITYCVTSWIPCFGGGGDGDLMAAGQDSSQARDHCSRQRFKVFLTNQRDFVAEPSQAISKSLTQPKKKKKKLPKETKIVRLVVM